MGILRLCTLTKLLASPQEQSEAIKQDYVAKKLEKLKVKHKLGQEDCFCIRNALKSNLQARYEDAVILRDRHFTEEDPQQALVDSAKASEDIGKIYQSIVAFELSTSSDERTKALSKIVNMLASNREALVHAAATQALIRLQKSAKNPKELHEFVARPLAIAIGMPFNGLPTCGKHREKIEHFIEVNFHGQLRNLGTAVKMELDFKKRFKTSAIMASLRIKRA